MARKPVLAAASVLLAGLGLTGCESGQTYYTQSSPTYGRSLAANGMTQSSPTVASAGGITTQPPQWAGLMQNAPPRSSTSSLYTQTPTVTYAPVRPEVAQVAKVETVSPQGVTAMTADGAAPTVTLTIPAMQIKVPISGMTAAPTAVAAAPSGVSPAYTGEISSVPNTYTGAISSVPHTTPIDAYTLDGHGLTAVPPADTRIARAPVEQSAAPPSPSWPSDDQPARGNSMTSNPALPYQGGAPVVQASAPAPDYRDQSMAAPPSGTSVPSGTVSSQYTNLATRVQYTTSSQPAPVAPPPSMPAPEQTGLVRMPQAMPSAAPAPSWPDATAEASDTGSAEPPPPPPVRRASMMGQARFGQ